MKPATPPATRLASKVDTSAGPDACWPFTGTRDRCGYGQLSIDTSHRVPAHRVALEVALGRPLADGERALHHCDNPPCCNPAHLYAGSQAQNVADLWRRDRRPRTGRPGERNPFSRLTAEAVDQIRRRYAAGGVTHRSLAAEYGVAESTVRAAIVGDTWAGIQAG